MNVKDQQKEQMNDLMEASDIIRKVLQRQSLSWIQHQDDGDCEAINTHIHNIDHLDKKQLHDAFDSSQIVQMVFMFLFSVINKHMEMQLLSQTRFRLLSKRQNQVYREQCDNLINDIQLVQEITETRLQKKITTQFNNLEHLRSENFRLLNVVQEKEEKCNTLLRSAEDIKEVRKLIVKFNRDLE